ncbi:MAG: isocitrate lyase/phosphoenolpyruvate mutase family protein [Acidimicrobiia bacterium]|nr:isocitrate lyase/phosphoenolpyruvate mutase family protein [Acidimicrobiia bacterium]
MTTQAEKAERFLALHAQSTPLLMPNPWDLGSARLLAAVGFEALATTSGGFAATLGRLDGSVTAGEAVTHAAAVAAAVDVPVSADFENCFADAPEGVEATVTRGVEGGLAGCSVEDWSGSEIYPLDLAAERVAAAANAAHGSDVHLVLTARCENFLHDRKDLADTITRLQRYQDAGADVLFAPGVNEADDIRTLLGEVDRPVNVLALPGVPTVAELAEIGVKRVSVGSGFLWTALGAVVEASAALREHGTFDYFDRMGTGLRAARPSFTRD